MADYHAKKRLGQHFLTSSEILRRIADLILEDNPGQIVEIGPGQGALTDLLAASGANVTAVEFDRDMLSPLRRKFSGTDNVTIIGQDFLKFEPTRHGLERFTLAGNIPYNITSPVIDWCVANRRLINRSVLMIQREMADRLAARPGTRNWSPIAILTQLHFKIVSHFDVPPEAFDPPPKVMSSVISLIPSVAPDIPNYELFERVVRASFKQRRKQLVNNLVPRLFDNAKALIPILDKMGLDHKCRAEQLSTAQFLQLTETLVSCKLI